MKGFEFEHIQKGNTNIHILRYPNFDYHEHLELLTNDEQERCFSFGHERRKREFVATRILRHQIFGFQHIHYDANGAPYLNDGTHISISHCRNFVAIAENQEYKIGLDLEAPRAGINNVMHKFLSSEELEKFDCSDEQTVSKIWSAKEALYKLAGRKQILFATELHVEMVSENLWNGRIVNHDHELHVKLNIFEHEGIIITVNDAPVEKI